MFDCKFYFIVIVKSKINIIKSVDDFIIGFISGIVLAIIILIFILKILLKERTNELIELNRKYKEQTKYLMKKTHILRETIQNYDKTKKKLSRLVDQGPFGFIEVSSDSKVSYISNKAKYYIPNIDIFDIKDFKSLENYVKRLLTEPVDLTNIFKNVYNNHNIVSIEIPIQFIDKIEKDLQIKHTEWIFVPILSADNQLISIFILIIDITEKKKELEKREEIARIDILNNMAGGIAHNLKNMLTPIMGSIRIMENDDIIKKKYNEDLKIIEKQMDRITDLTNRLMMLIKDKNPSKKLIDLRILIKEVLKSNKEILKKHKIEKRIPNEPIIVNVNETQIIEILCNLLINAAESMEEPGTIAIDVNIIEDKKEFGLEKKNDENDNIKRVEIKIKDQGPGIPIELKNKIFNNLITTKKNGNGFGLFSCNIIAKQNEGKLFFKNAKDRGAIFYLILPLIHD